MYGVWLFLIALGFGFLMKKSILPRVNRRLNRSADWKDILICWFTAGISFVSPMFMEYGGSLLSDHGDDDFQVISFDENGAVVASSPIMVWCLLENCANAIWKKPVMFNDSVVVDGQMYHIAIYGSAEVTNYSRFFSSVAPEGKPDGWWNTPDGLGGGQALRQRTSDALCQMMKNYAEPLVTTGGLMPDDDEDRAIGIQNLIDRYLNPYLVLQGVEFTVKSFDVRRGCNCPDNVALFLPTP
ncbi:MAG: hypothetical protein AAB390_04035 [Patescibacteria group bacterium]